MVKFLSLKTVILFGAGVLCLGGSGLLLSMGNVEKAVEGSARRPLYPDGMVEQVQGMDARLLTLEALVAEGRPENETEVGALTRQVRDLQFRVEDIGKRLERHEKKVDKRFEKTDNIVKVEKQVPSKRSPVSSHSQYHVVRNGETLYRISKRYNVSEHELIRLNGLKDKTRIFVGQTLRVTP
ncbi:hypothetical protein DSLASN_04780 [Desulfoluna limicola]|uniref:LysM domain-containing protein n=1 Tax=Desulfoluna limicola TaxID=2810562 RepID=A0ABN6EZX3_9BACT|nr:LysM domain-containing protein [Desulfoluna limicola]BCS94846.1 hypothetical protein DSLASN_04780 [Desulfoluna limicola]